MFTGLIRELGTVVRIAPRGSVVALTVDAPETSARLDEGDSVAVQGICLTVTERAGGRFTVEAAAETRRRTTLGSWRRGDRVHLEPALRVGDALDGHLVQGHVDGVGRVAALRPARGGGHDLTVALPRELARFLTPKGSVAVDGVSLTVDEGPFRDRFTVNLIPHTMAGTNLAALRPRAVVNLEMDVLVKAARTGRGFGGLRVAPADGPASATHEDSKMTVQRLRDMGYGRPRGGGRA